LFIGGQTFQPKNLGLLALALGRKIFGVWVWVLGLGITNCWVLGMGIGFGYKNFWVWVWVLGLGIKNFWVLGMGIGFGYKKFLGLNVC